MENKNMHSEELELIMQLLAVVNSKEEFDYLIAERARLLSFPILLKRRCSKW